MSNISKREGLIIYWCEGDKYKKGRYKVALTSADPIMLKAFIIWLRRYYNVDVDKIKVRLHLWKNSDIKKAKRWWSQTLGIPLRNFTRPYIKGMGKKLKYPQGICRVSIDSKKLLLTILKEIEQIKRKIAGGGVPGA